jgi:hypothetical protein
MPETYYVVEMFSKKTGKLLRSSIGSGNTPEDACTRVALCEYEILSSNSERVRMVATELIKDESQTFEYDQKTLKDNASSWHKETFCITKK